MAAARPGLSRSGSSIMAAGKTVTLVSGGDTGMGLEIVRALAHQPTQQILLGCRDTAAGEAAAASLGAPRNVNPIQLDVADDASLARAAQAVEQLFGKLDVLVHSADTAGAAADAPARPLRERYDDGFRGNATGAALLTEAMAPLLGRSRAPRVVMLSSAEGSKQLVLQSEGPPVARPWYGASMSAMNYLAVYYAKSYPEWRVNAVCPGLRATGLHAQEMEENEETDPAKGAARAVELILGDGAETGTYSHSGGVYPW